MQVITGKTGDVYHCDIDGGTYKITGEHTAVRDTDPADVEKANDVRISNWQQFHEDNESVPAGAATSNNVRISIGADAGQKDDGKFGTYSNLIDAAANKYGLPPNLIYAVIQQESGGNPDAVNATSGCTGLMQLKPGEFSGNLKDPANNIDQGSRYLAQLFHQKGDDPVAALAAYNLGPDANIDSTVPGQNGLTGRQYAQQVLAKAYPAPPPSRPA